MLSSVRLLAVTSTTCSPDSAKPSRRSTLFILPSGRNCTTSPRMSYTYRPAFLSVAITRLAAGSPGLAQIAGRSEEHTSELQSLMRISYAVFCLKKKNTHNTNTPAYNTYTKLHRQQTDT